MDKYLLIIDTEKYAGNFERELCAYITGQVGECGVGEAEAEIFKKEVDEETYEWLADNIEDVADDHGCRRPVKLSPTPGWFNVMGKHYKDSVNIEGTRYPAYLSVEIVFYKKPSEPIIELIAERTQKFKYRGQDIKLTAIRFVKRVVQDIEISRKDFNE